MSNLASSLHASLEQFVKPHSVKASFPIDRLTNRLAFMTVIVQAVAVLAANFAAQAKVTCATESGDENGTAATRAVPSVADKSYSESYCYTRGVDQTGLPDGTTPASFNGVLRHYLLQFYLPILFIIQAGIVYLPYYIWSQTAGECLRQNVQFVVELSKKLLADDAKGQDGDAGGGGDGCNSEESCRHRRMQHGRPSKADLLTDATLKRRLRRWYCKSKHTGQYCAFQLTRAVVIAAWLAFYVFFPGFRHEDIRYRFVCYLPSSHGTAGHRRFNCVLLQASLYEVGWTTNMSLLAFCLLATARQLIYFFPCVLGCRCRQCRTKRCLGACGKECRSHYFQRILGLVVQPKRSAEDEGLPLLRVGGGSGSYTEMEDGCTDYFSHRLADRYYISHLCYENSHLLDHIMPDMAAANASDEISSMGNLASIAMRLDRRSDQLEQSLGDAETKAKSVLSAKFGRRAAEAATEAAGAAVATGAEVVSKAELTK